MNNSPLLSPTSALGIGLSLVCVASFMTGCGIKKPMMKAMMPEPPKAQTVAQGGTVERPQALSLSPDIAQYHNHHAQANTGINSRNVSTLTPAWGYETETPVSHEPLVHEGAIYFADFGGNVYKLDARTGKEMWVRKDLQKPMTKWPWHGFAGTGALVDNVLVEASTEGTAYGLDSQTGRTLWQTELTDDPEAGSICKILAHDGLVYIGLQSVEEPMSKMNPGFKPNFQGRVLALDGKTGRIIWERLLAEAPQNGAGMWSSFALDTDLDLLYFTTSNSYTGEASPYSDSVVAVDPKSGEIRWHYQLFANDTWTPVEPLGPDFAFAAGPQLFDAQIDGKQRKLVGVGSKSGQFYTFDRESGERLYAANVGYSGVEGGMHAEASIGDGTIFAWSNNGYMHLMPPFMVMASVKAFDANTGRPIWAIDKAQPAGLFAAGLLADDVYFVGSLDGQARAYSARDGKKLWTSQAHGPIIGSLRADDGMLYFSTGVVGMFGDWASGTSGVFAYKAGRAAAARGGGWQRSELAGESR